MRRLAGLAIGPLLLTAAFLGFTGLPASAASQAKQPAPSQTCILIIICTPSSSSPAPSSSSATPAPSTSTSHPTSSASPTPTQGPTSTPTGPGSPSPTGGPTPTGSPSKSGSPGATGTHKRKAVTPKDASAEPGLVVPNVTWTMTVDSATLSVFTYKGNVNLPLAGGGTIQMMEFTVSSMSMSNITTLISESGLTGRETDAGFTASGVTMYATKLSGSVGGIPLTFTPQSASTVLLDLTNLVTPVLPITMTNITADQTVILAGQAQKNTVAVSD